MTVKELLKIVDGKLLNGDLEISFDSISTNTRTMKPDDLFIALKGKNTDGNKYVKEAIKKGCNIIITEEDTVTEITTIKVKDCHHVLFLLGKYYLKKYKIPLIAVTGSVGKTLTKDLISKILEKRYNVLKSEKNHNNHIGLPQTLFKLNNDHQIIVCELGMNHLNEISNLSKLCQPDVGVITKIGTSHIGNLGSKEEIFRAKAEIIDGMTSGPLIINGDDKYLNKIKYSNIIKCGLKRKNDLKAYDIDNDLEETRFKVNLDNDPYEFVFHIPGKHLINDVLLAIQVGLLFNIEIEDIKEAIYDFVSPNQRMNIIKLKNDNILIDDSYNASYESIIGGLDLIKKTPYIKVIILGDILELGSYSYKIHKKIINQTRKIPNSYILLLGDHFNEIKVKRKNIKQFSDQDELKKFLSDINFKQTLFYIKGSRGIHLEKIVNYLTKKR